MSKRILFVSDFLHAGGAEVILRHNIEIAKKQGYKISTLIGYNDYTVYGLLTGLKYLILSPFIFLKKALRFKPDIIHFYSYYHVFTPSILIGVYIYKLLNRNVKIIYSAHDMHIFTPNPGAFYINDDKVRKVDYYPTLKEALVIQWNNRKGNNWKGRVISLLARQFPWVYFYKILKLYNVFDLITVPSLFLKKLLKKIPHLRANIKLWRNPMDLSMFDELVKSHAYKKDSSDKLDLVFIARIDKDKGILDIINLLRKINIPDWHLTIIGDGPDLENVKDLINRYNLKNKITVTGRMPYKDAIAELSKHEILIMGSHWWENAPLTIVEAALLNLKILTRPYGGMKELSTLVGNNYYFDLTVSSLEKALHRIEQNSPEAPPISRKKLKNIFSEKHFIEKLPNFYN